MSYAVVLEFRRAGVNERAASIRVRGAASSVTLRYIARARVARRERLVGAASQTTSPIMPAGACPTQLCGVWQQDKARCQSMCPFLEGLGLPKSLLWAACPIVDNLHTTLRISCPEPGEIEVVDKTKMFGRNSTRVCTDGSETEVMTKARKKPFMLSAETDDHSATLICRLISRGPGFFTRQERFLSAEDTLVERHRLKRPGQEDVVVERIFTRDISKHEDLSLAPRAENAHTHGTSLNPVIGELLTRDAKDQ